MSDRSTYAQMLLAGLVNTIFVGLFGLALADEVQPKESEAEVRFRLESPL